MNKKIVALLITLPTLLTARFVEITSTRQFNDEIKKPVLVKFYTDWCPGCKVIAPTYKELGEEFSDIPFLSVNVEEVSELGRKYNITSIPRIFVLKPGEDKKEVDTKKPAIREAANNLKKNVSSPIEKPTKTEAVEKPAKKRMKVTVDTPTTHDAKVVKCGKETVVKLTPKEN